MQTFLPYKSFARSAAALDRQRLGKQRVECLQILNALLTPNAGWSRHPATLMWAGCEMALLDYTLSVCDEWAVARGYADTCADKAIAIVRDYDLTGDLEGYLNAESWYGFARPAWLGDESFHRAHQSNLIRKLPEHYAPMFPGVPAGLEYIWPEGRVTLLPDLPPKLPEPTGAGSPKKEKDSK